MPLLLREKHVTDLLDIDTAIAAVEEVLSHQALGVATNRSRYRVAMPTSHLNLMAAGDTQLGVTGVKIYTVSRKGARFLVLLYSAENGDLLAMIEADRLGQMRTGAASGVATKFMARKDAETVGIFGTGWQSESQLMAVCAVRPIKSISAYGRNAERREKFAKEMSELLKIDVSGVDSPEKAASGKAIIITSTSSREPVLKREWIDPGTHLNIVGSNFLSKSEIDVETVKAASIIAVDSIEQSRLEAGDLLGPIERGAITWESVTELGRIVAGREAGRKSDQDITLFKSNGIALEDISTALRVYQSAKERGVGEQIEMWS